MYFRGPFSQHVGPHAYAQWQTQYGVTAAAQTHKASVETNKKIITAFNTTDIHKGRNDKAERRNNLLCSESII